MPAVTSVQPADHPRIVEVWEAAVRQTHTFLTEEDIDFFRPLVRDKYLDMVELVAVRDDDGQVTGFAGVAGNRLEMLFVDPAWHGRGIGRRLVDYAMQQMGAHLVDVNEQNDQAVGFYRHLGADVIGRSDRDGMGKPFPLLHLRLPVEEQA